VVRVPRVSVRSGPDGSVDTYNDETAVAKLFHGSATVNVDFSLLVRDLQLHPREWINVIGYVEQDREQWVVKALMSWPTTPGFNLDKYENAVTGRTGT
jgi:Telomere capping, CST complex subunit